MPKIHLNALSYVIFKPKAKKVKIIYYEKKTKLLIVSKKLSDSKNNPLILLYVDPLDTKALFLILIKESEIVNTVVILLSTNT